MDTGGGGVEVGHNRGLIENGGVSGGGGVGG